MSLICSYFIISLLWKKCIKELMKSIKGTLMQIWESPYVYVHMITIPWKFRILNPKNSRVICLWSFWIFVNKLHISHVRISQKVKGVLMWNLQHIIFISRRRYWQIFKSALVYLQHLATNVVRLDLARVRKIR